MTNQHAHLIPLTVTTVNPTAPRAENWQHGVIWHNVDEIAIALGDAHWYGQGGLVHQDYPLERLAQHPAPFITSDNGATGLLGILHPFWFNSRGAGILIEACDALETSFNAPLNGAAHAHSFNAPAPPSERPFSAGATPGDGLLHIRGRGFRVRFFHLENPRQVVEAFWQLIRTSPPPPDSYFQKTLWTTWAQFKNDISHTKVTELAHKIQESGFNCGVLGIDAKWQDEFGSTRFDPAKFPDPRQTTAELHALGMGVTLWCVPFFHPATGHYRTAIDRGYALRRHDGSPYVVDWWEGQGALLNIADATALNWHLENLQNLALDNGIDGFKFDAGEGMFYASPEIARQHAPNHYTHAYIDQIAQRFPHSDVRSAWHNQAAPMLFRQWDKSSQWGFDNGLASCIPQAITLNLLGYPFSFPDMIGGNQYREEKASAELLIRWAQAVAPMPHIQFSLAPWDFGAECTRLCAQAAHLHSELAPRTMALARGHAPLVRPLWWLAPGDEDALTCKDSYLIGDDLLVAPVIVPGADRRDIYLPDSGGRWRSYWDRGEVHQGGTWLHDYPAPLEKLPLFERA